MAEDAAGTDRRENAERTVVRERTGVSPTASHAIRIGALGCISPDLVRGSRPVKTL